MAGNPKESPWFSTLAAKRKRKPVTLTLSDAGRASLDALAAKRGLSLSALVEQLAREAEQRG